MERADSVAFDFHKWLHVPYDVGCVLVRDREAHRKAYTSTPAYLARQAGGLSAGPVWFPDYGPQLSRSFRALKVWMTLKAYGVEAFGRLAEQNVKQARYLAELVQASPELELLAPVPLNIVCFRYVAPGLDAAALDELNEHILVRLQESGAAAPTQTRIDGRYCLRAAIANHRSRREDFDLLVREVLRLGRERLGAASQEGEAS
jgi:glutamate/tyrosine decarboxylase-like PLP-dependent enzyme